MDAGKGEGIILLLKNNGACSEGRRVVNESILKESTI